ncbi:hypothetical protein GA0061098_103474 [Bradyrhizobium shewense]|uniref:Uncharacterized protein n=1 Tax=Bradyrhizobium shewense TaxID=1761772 RepID=A0A1C3XS60_9BRAD|nr:hypothetical protein GA0061098_103474 [Bradyrhizobium shewense]
MKKTQRYTPWIPASSIPLPAKGIVVPARPRWFQEVKHDRYRPPVRLITRGGYN